MTSMYQFTKYVPSETDLNNDRQKDIIPIVCFFSYDSEDNESFRDCIVVAYRESWCDFPSDSIQYQNYKVGNRLMHRKDSHFSYHVNTVDDSILIVDSSRGKFQSYGLSNPKYDQFVHWLKHYWYKHVV